MDELLEFYSDINKLKHTERKGWINKGVQGTRDTIASHSFGAALLGWALAGKEGLDPGKIVKMLLMHDMIMAHMEDLVPGQKEYNSKREIENQAAEKLFEHIPEFIRQELTELFREYQEETTKEAIFARECDKLDTLLQAREYSIATGIDILPEFIRSYKDKFRTKTGRKAISIISD